MIKTSNQINVPVLGLQILVRFGGEARSLIQKLDPDYPAKMYVQDALCTFLVLLSSSTMCCSSSSTKSNSRSSSNNSSMRSRRRSRSSSSRRSRNERRKTVGPNPGAILMFQSFKALNLMAYLQYWINKIQQVQKFVHQQDE